MTTEAQGNTRLLKLAGLLEKMDPKKYVGASSWLNTHCLLYANGKRSLINVIDGEWRL